MFESIINIEGKRQEIRLVNIFVEMVGRFDYIRCIVMYYFNIV